MQDVDFYITELTPIMDYEVHRGYVVKGLWLSRKGNLLSQKHDTFMIMQHQEVDWELVCDLPN